MGKRLSLSESLLAKGLAKFLMWSFARIEKSDVMITVLKRLRRVRKIRMVWKGFCEAGQSLFTDWASEMRDARNWDVKVDE